MQRASSVGRGKQMAVGAVERTCGDLSSSYDHDKCIGQVRSSNPFRDGNEADISAGCHYSSFGFPSQSQSLLKIAASAGSEIDDNHEQTIHIKNQTRLSCGSSDDCVKGPPNSVETVKVTETDGCGIPRLNWNSDAQTFSSRGQCSSSCSGVAPGSGSRVGAVQAGDTQREPLPEQSVSAICEALQVGSGSSFSMVEESAELVPVRGGTGHVEDHVAEQDIDTKQNNSAGVVKATQSARAQDQKRQFFTVNGKQYSVLGMEGQGGSSRVFKVLDEKGSIFALKSVCARDARQLASYEREIDFLKAFAESETHGEFAIRMYDFEVDRPNRRLKIVLEHATSDVRKILLNAADRLAIVHIMQIWGQMVDCTVAAHAMGVIHADLKPENFLLVGNLIKLADFGLSSRLDLDNEQTHVSRCGNAGTLNYMPPEAFSQPERRDGALHLRYAFDIWALGVMLFELVYRCVPYAEYSHSQFQRIGSLLDMTLVIQYPFPERLLSKDRLGAGIPGAETQILRALWILERCLQHNPSRRWSAMVLQSKVASFHAVHDWTQVPEVKKPRRLAPVGSPFVRIDDCKKAIAMKVSATRRDGEQVDIQQAQAKFESTSSSSGRTASFRKSAGLSTPDGSRRVVVHQTGSTAEDPRTNTKNDRVAASEDINAVIIASEASTSTRRSTNQRSLESALTNEQNEITVILEERPLNEDSTEVEVDGSADENSRSNEKTPASPANCSRSKLLLVGVSGAMVVALLVLLSISLSSYSSSSADSCVSSATTTSVDPAAMSKQRGIMPMNWCEDLGGSSRKDLDGIAGGGWCEVRSSPPGNTWFAQTDRLSSVEIYPFSEMLFVTGNLAKWIIMKKEDVYGEYRGPRQIWRSYLSDVPRKAIMQRSISEGMWISQSGGSPEDAVPDIFYAEDSATHYTTNLRMGGIIVCVRLVDSTTQQIQLTNDETHYRAVQEATSLSAGAHVHQTATGSHIIQPHLAVNEDLFTRQTRPRQIAAELQRRSASPDVLHEGNALPLTDHQQTVVGTCSIGKHDSRIDHIRGGNWCVVRQVLRSEEKWRMNRRPSWMKYSDRLAFLDTKADFSEILFISADLTKWMVMKKWDFLGEYEGLRTVVASNESSLPKQVFMYRNLTKGMRISTTTSEHQHQHPGEEDDHSSNEPLVFYQEGHHLPGSGGDDNSRGMSSTSRILEHHGGVYVCIRNTVNGKLRIWNPPPRARRYGAATAMEGKLMSGQEDDLQEASSATEFSTELEQRTEYPNGPGLPANDSVESYNRLHRASDHVVRMRHGWHPGETQGLIKGLAYTQINLDQEAAIGGVVVQLLNWSELGIPLLSKLQGPPKLRVSVSTDGHHWVMMNSNVRPEFSVGPFATHYTYSTTANLPDRQYLPKLFHYCTFDVPVKARFIRFFAASESDWEYGFTIKTGILQVVGRSGYSTRDGQQVELRNPGSNFSATAGEDDRSSGGSQLLPFPDLKNSMDRDVSLSVTQSYYNKESYYNRGSSLLSLDHAKLPSSVDNIWIPEQTVSHFFRTWSQIDLGSDTWVVGVVTQGQSPALTLPPLDTTFDSDSSTMELFSKARVGTSSYVVMYSKSNSLDYAHVDGGAVFLGNTAENSHDLQHALFEKPVFGRYIVISPVSCMQYMVGLRWGVLVQTKNKKSTD